MIKYDGIVYPQAFLAVMTGKCFCVTADNQLEEIENILDEELGGGQCWSYPFEETEDVVKSNKSVVLVEIVNINEECEQERLYRWFEVPEEWTKEEFAKRLSEV